MLLAITPPWLMSACGNIDYYVAGARYDTGVSAVRGRESRPCGFREVHPAGGSPAHTAVESSKIGVSAPFLGESCEWVSSFMVDFIATSTADVLRRFHPDWLVLSFTGASRCRTTISRTGSAFRATRHRSGSSAPNPPAGTRARAHGAIFQPTAAAWLSRQVAFSMVCVGAILFVRSLTRKKRHLSVNPGSTRPRASWKPRSGLSPNENYPRRATPGLQADLIEPLRALPKADARSRGSSVVPLTRLWLQENRYLAATPKRSEGGPLLSARKCARFFQHPGIRVWPPRNIEVDTVVASRGLSSTRVS